MEQLMSKKKRFIKHWISLIIILFLLTLKLSGQIQNSTEDFIEKYIYQEKLDSLSMYLNSLTVFQKEQLIYSVHNYLVDRRNFVCENIIYVGNSKLKYNWKMEILDNWEMWRSKKELVYILMHDLLAGKITDCSNIHIINKYKIYFIEYRGRVKKMYPFGKQSYSCENRLVEKVFNKNVLKCIESHYKKVINLIQEEGLKRVLDNEKYKLPDDIKLMDFRCAVDTIKQM